MKITLRIGGLASTLAAGLLFAGSAIAVEGSTVNQSYVGDSQGKNVMDSSGNCVRTSSWKVEDMTVECGAEPPAPEVVEATPPPPPPPVVSYEKTTMSTTALFDFDSDVLKEEGKVSLQELASRGGAKETAVCNLSALGLVSNTYGTQYEHGSELRGYRDPMAASTLSTAWSCCRPR